MRAEINAKGTRLELEFRSFRELVTELGPNISSEGLFVETPTPAERGSQLEFSVKLQDDYQLIHGTGRVVWVRAAGTPADPPAGMALQFLEVVLSSPDLIERLIETHRAEGGETFDLTQEPRQPVAPGPVKLKIPEPAAVAEQPPAPSPSGDRSSQPLDVALTQEIPASPSAPPLRPPPPQEPVLATPSSSEPQRADRTRELAPAVAEPAPREPRTRLAETYDGVPGRRKPPRLSVTPSLIVLLVASGVIGGLTYRFTESLLFLMTDVRGGTEAGEFGDIPPAASLQAGRRAARSAATPLPPPEAATTGTGVDAPGPADGVTDYAEPATAGELDLEIGPVAIDSPPPFVGPPFTRIRYINWRPHPEGRGTEIVLTGDGFIATHRFEHVPLTQREAIKLYDVDWPYPKRMIEVGTPEVIRIRTGFHSRPSGNELHVVLDLQTPEVTLQEIRTEGSKLLLWVSAP